MAAILLPATALLFGKELNDTCGCVGWGAACGATVANGSFTTTGVGADLKDPKSANSSAADVGAGTAGTDVV
jgi:hypothetical protein